MKTGTALAYLLLFTVAASAQPTVTSVVNGASGIAGPVAPGELISIFGSGFGTSTTTVQSLPIPTTLDGVSVAIDGTALGLLFIGAGQINAVAPAQLQPTTGHELVVTVGSASSSPFQITGAVADPGIFTPNSSSQAFAFNMNGSTNSSSNPAAPGSTLSVFFTGGGQTNPPFVDYSAPSASSLAQSVVVGLNNSGVPVEYAGLTPSSIGFDQVNIQIPSGTASGNVPIVIEVTEPSGQLAFSQSGVTVAIGASQALAGLEIVSGNNQSASPNQAFSQPLVVQAVDSNGNPLSGVAITWSVSSGSATLTNVSAVTGANGQATANVTAGAAAGTIVISVSAGGFANVSFSLAVTSKCNPTSLVVAVTTPSNGSTVPTAFPIAISAIVTDNCANPVNTGTVAVSFSDGDPTLALNSLGNGDWSGTWVPRNVASSIVLTVSAFLPEPGGSVLAGQAQVTVTQGSTIPNPPSISAVTDGASFKTTVSPGSFVTIFGSNLASSTAQAGSLPLPISLGNASVLVGSSSIPIYYASPSQINAILPYTLPVNVQLQAVVQNGTALSQPVTITISEASPGVFSYGQNQGIVTNTSSALISPSNPAARGSFVVIYCSGLGATNPSLTAGAQSPSSPLAHTTIQPTATIGGVSAEVTFAGLTPGLTGLYQINLVVPNNAPTGNQVPLMISVDNISSVAVNMAVK